MGLPEVIVKTISIEYKGKIDIGSDVTKLADAIRQEMGGGK